MGTVAAGGSRTEREGMIACLVALLALGLIGTLGLSGWWSTDAAHTVRHNVSPPVYHVIDDTVRKILAHRQLFWVTLGAVIAVWEVSGAMRATMQVLNRVYGVEEKRSFGRKIGESIVLSTAVTFMLLLALAVVKVGPDTAKDVLGDGAA